jgi:DAACS family dicarboxylate/amino acid:cation (Na+ or H+) symporter
MLLVNTLRPGESVALQQAIAAQPSAGVQALQANAAARKSVADTIIELVPRNPLESAVRALDGEMLPLMVFALIFGVAVSRTAPRDDQRNVLMRFLEQAFDASMQIVHFAMKLAPFAVFAIIFNTAFTFGTAVFATLFFYVATVVAALLLHQFGVYAVLLRLVARRSPIEFFRQCRDVYLYAFSTASSNATLPLSLETAEKELHLPPDIARFVLTVGATANQNGTALFEGVTVLFLAQVYGLDLTLGQQVRVMLMSILAGIGTAGVPGGSLPMVMIVAQSVGIPAEGMGLILGVDRFLDMCRTTVNVTGDLAAAVYVSRGERTGPAAAPTAA